MWYRSGFGDGDRRKEEAEVVVKVEGQDTRVDEYEHTWRRKRKRHKEFGVGE